MRGLRVVVLAAITFSLAACCRDEEGVTVSCSCTGVDSTGNRVPVSVPSGGCADTTDTAAIAHSFERECNKRASACSCSCTLLGEACTYEHCSSETSEPDE